MIDTISFIDYLQEYLDYAKLHFAASTYKTKVRLFRIALEVIDVNRPFVRTTKVDALAIMHHVQFKVSTHSANLVRKELGAAWSWGEQYYDIDEPNPFYKCKPFAEEMRRKYVPPEEDFWAVYDKASEHDKQMLLFMFHTGARRGEVFSLKWEQVDLERKRVLLWSSKGGRGVRKGYVPLTDHLAQTLAKMHTKATTEYVFVDPETNRPYTAKGTLMKRLCNRAGVRYFSFHAIRHLCATTLAQRGMSCTDMQSVLRHSSIVTTSRYIHTLGVSPAKMNEVFTTVGPAL